MPERSRPDTATPATRPDDRRPTLVDVARRAGVHKTTASRALSPQTRGMVKPDTVRRVMDAAERLGYVPDTIARGLRTRRTGAIGVLVPDLTNPLFPPIVRGIEDRLAASGYATLLANTDSDEARERAQYLALESRRADGFIVATARLVHPLLSRVARRGVPLVQVNRYVDGLDVPAVIGDDGAGITRAVEHLTGLGHRRIGHLAGPPEVSTGLTRQVAFCQAMQALSVPAPPEAVVTCTGYTEDAGREAACRLLAGYPEVTAIVAGNDLIALGAIAALAEAGRACPGDCSVVGFNDMPFADKMRPPLTTVRVPHYEMGIQAAQLLLERLCDPYVVAKKVLLPVRLVMRGSTAVAALPTGTRRHAYRAS